MVPNVIPPKEILNKLKRPLVNYDIWKHVPLFLCVALLLVMGISFMITYSGPKTADVGIASTSDCSTVNGMTAYQCDFSTTNGTNMKTTDNMLKTNYLGTFYGGGSGGSGGSANAYGADVKGRKTSNGANFLGLGFGSDEPAGDVKLPMNAYLPGRGQPEGGRTLLGFEWNMIPGGGGVQAWNFDDADLSGILAGPVNISCVQRISTEMMNRVFGGNSSQYCGVVMVNDCAGAGNKPQIIVLRLLYSDGKARIVNKNTDVRVFRIDNNSGQNTADGFPATKAKVLLDGGADNTWYHRLNSDGSCNNNYIHPRVVNGVKYGDIFKYNPDSSPPNSTSAINYSSSGLTGYVHDVHMIPDGTDSYAFYTTIVNWGVYAFRPVTSTPGSTDDRLNRPWCYPMYTMSKDYITEQGGHDPSDYCYAPDGTIVLIWHWQIRDKGIYTQRLEQSTSWSCTPLNSGLVDISVSPWKSYVNNDPPDANHPNSLRNRLQAFQGNSTWYNRSINYWNGANWSSTYDGYPWSNNDSGPGQYVARSEVVRVQESNNTVVHNYGPGITDGSKPYWGGNMTPGRESIQNDSNYFNVGANRKVVLGLGGDDHMGDVMHLDPKARPRIWGSGIAGGGIKVPGTYNETAFPFPNGNILVNGSGDYANGHGTPTVLNKSGNTLWTLAGANDTYYTHFGAGVFPAYGTSKPTDSGWSILGKSYKEIYNNRDGGFASQLGPAPNSSYVRDFTSMKVNGLNRAESDPNYGSKSKISYALADSNGTIFMDPAHTLGLNQASNTIDLSGLVKEDGTGLLNNNLENYQQIYLNSLMWGDIGNNIGAAQMSNSPILKAWGINYQDKSGSLNAGKTGTGGTSPDPQPANYPDDGGSQFYTKKDQNMARYKTVATNTPPPDADGGWSVNNIKLVDTITNTGGTTAKTTFDKTVNKAYYRVIPKGGGSGTQGTLTVRAAGTKDEWTTCDTRADCTNAGGSVGAECGKNQIHDCDYSGSCSGTDYHTESCGSYQTGCKYSAAAHETKSTSCGSYTTGCKYSAGSHESFHSNCTPTPVGCKWCGGSTDYGCSAHQPGQPTGSDCCNSMYYIHRYCQSGPIGGNYGRPCPGCGGTANQCNCYNDRGHTYTHDNGDHYTHDNGDRCVQYKFNCTRTVWPHMKVFVDGKLAEPTNRPKNPDGSVTVDNTGFQGITFNYTLSESNCVKIVFTNDSSHWPTDNNLFVDSVTLSGGNQPNSESVSNTPCNVLTPKGANMYCNGDLNYPCTSSFPWYPIPDANITVSGAIYDQDTGKNIGGTTTFSIPNAFHLSSGVVTNIISEGDRIEVIYTDSIVRAGLIKNKAHFAFNNKGNSIGIESGESTCIGNAPYISTQSGDVYLGGGVHPYFAYYGNATFLIQSGNGALTNFNSSKKGWVQNNYKLADELRRVNVAAALKTNIQKLIDKGELEEIVPIASGPFAGFGSVDIGRINRSAKGVYQKTGILIVYGDASKQFIVNNGLSKLVANMGGDIYIKGPSTENGAESQSYEPAGASSLDNLASIGYAAFINPRTNSGGSISVQYDVKKIVGAYFAENVFNSSTLNYGPPSDPNIPLTCEGLWIAHAFSLPRTYVGADKQPAERVIYDGRVALNPPPGFSKIGDLMPIWREVAP